MSVGEVGRSDEEELLKSFNWKVEGRDQRTTVSNLCSNERANC